MKIIIPIVLFLSATAWGTLEYLGKNPYYFLMDVFENIFPFKLREEEKKILFRILILKYHELEFDLTELIINLIKDKQFLEILADKIRELRTSNNTNLNKILSEPKKIFILGETGVGKSTLINCIEEKELAPEAKVSAPTTMEYKEYNSSKNKNYIFCDTRGIETKNYSKISKSNIKKF